MAFGTDKDASMSPGSPARQTRKRPRCRLFAAIAAQDDPDLDDRALTLVRDRGTSNH
jgi:hypothetical protein